MNRIIAALSIALSPGERECVCGDLEELRLSTPAAAANILGLVIRRQRAEWLYWGPWIALFGVTGLAGSSISEDVGQVHTWVFMQIGTYLTYGVAYEPGGVNVVQEIAYTAILSIAMLLWSWACGFVLASLSGRALWMTAFLFYCVVRDSWTIRLALAGSITFKHGLWGTMLFRLLHIDPLMMIFLLALALGVCSARKRMLKRNIRRFLAAIGLTLVILLVWMESWFAAGFAHWSGQAYVATPFLYRMLPLLAGAWPVFSIWVLGDRLHGQGMRYRSL